MLELNIKQGRFVPKPEYFDVNSLDDLSELFGSRAKQIAQMGTENRSHLANKANLTEVLKRIRGLPKKMKAKVVRRG